MLVPCPVMLRAIGGEPLRKGGLSELRELSEMGERTNGEGIGRSYPLIVLSEVIEADEEELVEMTMLFPETVRHTPPLNVLTSSSIHT